MKHKTHFLLRRVTTCNFTECDFLASFSTSKDQRIAELQRDIFCHFKLCHDVRNCFFWDYKTGTTKRKCSHTCDAAAARGFPGSQGQCWSGMTHHSHQAVSLTQWTMHIQQKYFWFHSTFNLLLVCFQGLYPSFCIWVETRDASCLRLVQLGNMAPIRL